MTTCHFINLYLNTNVKIVIKFICSVNSPLEIQNNESIDRPLPGCFYALEPTTGTRGVPEQNLPCVYILTNCSQGSRETLDVKMSVHCRVEQWHQNTRHTSGRNTAALWTWKQDWAMASINNIVSISLHPIFSSKKATVTPPGSGSPLNLSTISSVLWQVGKHILGEQ